MKKILVIGNYFYPDVASLGQLITDFCFELKDKYEFIVIASIPNYSNSIELNKKQKKSKFYNENINGIKVKRIIVPNFNKKNKLSRIKYILKYIINSISAINSIEDYDIIFTVSQPPVMGGLLGLYAKIKKKKSRLIYNIQDFNPEQIEAVNYSKFKFIISILKFLDNISIKYSNKILLVGRDQIETLRKRSESFIKRAVIINNWTDDNEIIPINKENFELINFKNENKINDKYIIMYSGNIGLFYDLENLLKVIIKFKDRKDILFVFIGEGAVKKDLINMSKDIDNIKFLPYQKKEDLKLSLNSADVHLVVNAKGIKGVSVPSKLYGVMASGTPIIGVLEEGSEARIIIEESKCGICISPGNYEEFESVINEFINNKEEYKDLGKEGRKYLDNNLNRRKSISEYDKLFSSL